MFCARRMRNGVKLKPSECRVGFLQCHFLVFQRRFCLWYHPHEQGSVLLTVIKMFGGEEVNVATIPPQHGPLLICQKNNYLAVWMCLCAGIVHMCAGWCFRSSRPVDTVVRDRQRMCGYISSLGPSHNTICFAWQKEIVGPLAGPSIVQAYFPYLSVYKE
jgi:hypothetical protein